MNADQFQNFAAPLPEPLFLLTPEGATLGANPAALRLLNARREQVSGLRLAELAADPEPEVAAFLDACRRSAQFTFGVLRLCTNGAAPVECRVEGAVIRDDHSAAILLRATPKASAASRFAVLNDKIEELARESAERKQAVEELQRSRRRLEAVLDHSTAAVYLKDAECRYVLVNRQYEAIVGVGRDQVAGKTDHDVFPAEVADALRANDRLVLERREPLEFEEVLPHPSGQRTFLSIKFPVPDPVTGAAGVGGISTDITERKRLDEQLRETQKLESLGVLAGGVAHDFNNLLTGIMGNASVALETVPEDNPASAAIREVLDASERAAHLTRQMLAYAGKGRFVVERLDLSETVRDIANLVRISVPRNVDLRLELARNLPRVEADPGQMQQLVMNLVINGAEAIGERDAGTVLVTTGQQEIDSEYIDNHFAAEKLKPGEYVFLEVHDTGIGMDEATRARIFDPFFTTKFTGRGLGLSAVQGIVRGHGGAIRVYSTPGAGTTFRVLFPAMAADAPQRAAAPSRADVLGSGTVLIVDDEELVRRTAKAMLERYGYRVLTAENGLEAVDIFRRDPSAIDLVLLDLTMPVMGGEEAFRRLEAVKPGVRVLLSSGYNEVEAIRRFTGTKVAGFIQKPYTSARLGAKVKEILGKSG